MKEQEGVRIIEEESLGNEDVAIKLVIVTSLPNGDKKVNEMEGESILCAVGQADGNTVAMIGNIHQQVEAVYSILTGVTGRIMEAPHPMQRILLYTMLMDSITRATGTFDPLGGDKDDGNDQ